MQRRLQFLREYIFIDREKIKIKIRGVSEDGR
jgi:hypothetical protein